MINQFCKTKQPHCLHPLEGGNYQDSGCHTRATLLWSFPMRNTGYDEKGGGTNNLEQINKFDQLRIILSFFQDFSHDGQAPDVFFWADGTIIPYITRYISGFFGDVKNIVASRNDLQPKIGLERFLPREDIVSVQSNFYSAQWGIFIKIKQPMTSARCCCCQRKSQQSTTSCDWRSVSRFSNNHICYISLRLTK